ncbi:hypothetical protein Zmor_003820 [Zophobas morio]|uniref:CCHC-type domain-containing protein n=1 Tax=Zophobas morio TaxID=2755281 RepID=A0AA38HPT5_9CUCU|nr:hypothetical protein Zmor_003820 [Zophobas morio]
MTSQNLFPSKDQAIVVAAIEGIKLEDYVLAVGNIVQPKNVLFASRLANNRICIYLSSKEFVEEVVSCHSQLTIKDQTVSVRRLINPARRIILSNVCPSIPHEIFVNQLLSLGFVPVSQMNFLKARLEINEYAHVLSFRRHIFVQPDYDRELPQSLVIKYDNTPYRIFLNYDNVCYKCRKTGHIASDCQSVTLTSTMSDTADSGTPVEKSSLDRAENTYRAATEIDRSFDSSILSRRISENDINEVGSVARADADSADKSVSNKRQITTEDASPEFEVNHLDFSRDSTESLTGVLELLEPARDMIENCDEDFPLNFDKLTNFMEEIVGFSDALKLFNINIMYTNILSLMSKLRCLELYIHANNPACVLLTETWLSSQIPDASLGLTDYNVYRTDRDGRGGGVCVLLNKSIFQRFRVSRVKVETPQIESLFLQLCSNEFTFSLGCVYRPSSTLIANDIILISELRRLSEAHSNFIVAGDFNFPYISWPLKSISANHSSSGLFSNLIVNSSLVQLVTEPTRFRSGQTPSLLDLVLTNQSNLVGDVQVSSPMGKSDHAVLEFNVQILVKKEPKHMKKKITKIDIPRIKHYLGNNCDWSVNPKKPWIKRELMKAIKIKKRLWQKFKATKLESDYREHRKFSNKLSFDLKKAKTQYENSLIGKGNKAIYKYARQKMSSKVSMPLIRRPDGSLSESNLETANLLADYFESVYVTEPPGVLPIINTPRLTECLENVILTGESLLNELSALRIDSAPGPDNITYWLIPLNNGKCKVLHLGTNNPKHIYMIDNEAVKMVDSQNDLGVIITSDLSWSNQVAYVARRANSASYMLFNAFRHPSRDTFLKLFKSYIRPILEYANVVWSPILQRDKELLEKVQRRATKKVLGYRTQNYQTRLRCLNLTSLEQRRKRGDLILVYKIFHNPNMCHLKTLFELNTNQLRGHVYKLKKQSFRTIVRRFFFPNRVFDEWNNLDSEIVNVTSVNMFKNKLDQ